jgi:uncharacterized RDD family membrane protein YckC
MKAHTILTPEHVPVELPPAGLGSRFLALTVDFAIITGVAGVIRTIFVFVLPRAVADAAALTVAFALTWSYHVFFEVVREGRSPGKRAAGLRVVDAQGLPLTWQQSFVRNAARVLDAAPIAYGLGALVCRFDPLHRRLGDLLAGTVVIREARAAAYDRRHARGRTFNSLRTPRVLRVMRRRVGLAERELLFRLVERADELDPPVRFALMQEIAAHYRGVLGIDDPHLSGENLVRGLAEVLAPGRALR